MYIINTLFWFLPLMLTAILRLLIPIEAWETICSKVADNIAVAWISVNNFTQRFTTTTQFQVEGTQDLTLEEWYLVTANHQSWVDILVLQRIFNRRIPFLKFFLKKELIWVPFMGMCWWALDFPFMKRYTRQFLEKNPHLKGKDIETTRKACSKFKLKPISVMNFAEGTRFTELKHDNQASPYRNLLRPRAGGMAFVLSAMGDQLHRLVDVTIHYPSGIPTFWDYLSGRVEKVSVNVRVMPIDKSLIGDYFNDPAFQEHFQTWLNGIWHEKDQLLDKMASEEKARPC